LPRACGGVGVAPLQLLIDRIRLKLQRIVRKLAPVGEVAEYRLPPQLERDLAGWILFRVLQRAVLLELAPPTLARPRLVRREAAAEGHQRAHGEGSLRPCGPCELCAQPLVPDPFPFLYPALARGPYGLWRKNGGDVYALCPCAPCASSPSHHPVVFLPYLW